MLVKSNSTHKKPMKYLAVGLLGLGLLVVSSKSFAQSAPPPPPTPEEALKSTGKALKSINPFKKRSNAAAPAPGAPPALGTPPAGGPPPPPNPLNLFKKKKSASATLPVPPKPPGRD